MIILISLAIAILICVTIHTLINRVGIRFKYRNHGKTVERDEIREWVRAEVRAMLAAAQNEGE